MSHPWAGMFGARGPPLPPRHDSSPESVRSASPFNEEEERRSRQVQRDRERRRERRRRSSSPSRSRSSARRDAPHRHRRRVQESGERAGRRGRIDGRSGGSSGRRSGGRSGRRSGGRSGGRSSPARRERRGGNRGGRNEGHRVSNQNRRRRRPSGNRSGNRQDHHDHREEGNRHSSPEIRNSSSHGILRSSVFINSDASRNGAHSSNSSRVQRDGGTRRGDRQLYRAPHRRSEESSGERQPPRRQRSGERHGSSRPRDSSPEIITLSDDEDIPLADDLLRHLPGAAHPPPGIAPPRFNLAPEAGARRQNRSRDLSPEIIILSDDEHARLVAQLELEFQERRQALENQRRAAVREDQRILRAAQESYDQSVVIFECRNSATYFAEAALHTSLCNTDNIYSSNLQPLSSASSHLITLTYNCIME
ncbi:hypothetical protein CAEBREN_17579 [Caenorhabditis brenneri]|uniref:Uncharacterized protein n=1 Tax=Caenorhabditis brenneri TaxID=135651 RepID=G0NSS8_CAEBE|nr:hypothetical protein CAEBREN_17579 [Caenorhabditis brenneri]